MDKITFKNNGQPAINDTNLNKMQDNIEKEFDNINKTLSDYTVEQRSMTLLGNYFSNVDVNTLIKTGNIVQIVFRGQIANDIPNNESILSDLPIPAIGSSEAGNIVNYGSQYGVTEQGWGYLLNGQLKINGHSAGVWIHINHTFICE